MKSYLTLLLLISFTVVIFAGSDSLQLPDIKYEKLAFGNDSTFEIVTWNIQNFPKSEHTVHYSANIIKAVDADLYALQEIEDPKAFYGLVNELNEIDDDLWAGFRANSDDWDLNLAYIFKDTLVTIRKVYEIFHSEEDHYALPRHPLVMECEFDGHELVVINNHYKAMPGPENESRRRAATEKLSSIIKQDYGKNNVILLGDLNDNLADPDSLNVFLDFINDTENFRFVDQAIAADSTSDWSYPYWKYRSHLDHIMISDELFNAFNSKSSEVRVITIDKFMEGGEEYRYKYITDHRPVALKLDLTGISPQ